MNLNTKLQNFEKETQKKDAAQPKKKGHWTWHQKHAFHEK